MRNTARERPWQLWVYNRAYSRAVLRVFEGKLVAMRQLSGPEVSPRSLRKFLVERAPLSWAFGGRVKDALPARWGALRYFERP
jgi:hypothetical protein